MPPPSVRFTATSGAARDEARGRTRERLINTCRERLNELRQLRQELGPALVVPSCEGQPSVPQPRQAIDGQLPPYPVCAASHRPRPLEETTASLTGKPSSRQDLSSAANTAEVWPEVRHAGSFAARESDSFKERTISFNDEASDSFERLSAEGQRRPATHAYPVCESHRSASTASHPAGQTAAQRASLPPPPPAPPPPSTRPMPPRAGGAAKCKPMYPLFGGSSPLLGRIALDVDRSGTERSARSAPLAPLSHRN